MQGEKIAVWRGGGFTGNIYSVNIISEYKEN
jgi:hypothetical protein